MKANGKCPRLNETLKELGVDPIALDQAAAEYYERSQLRENLLYGEYLIANKIAPPEQVALALSRQATHRGEYVNALKHLIGASDELHQRLVSHVTTIEEMIRCRQ
jgi:hypothetical protein